MNDFYICEAREVPSVEGEDALDAVDMHGCDQAGVMHLDAGDVVGDEELAPFLVNCDAVRQQLETRFDRDGAAICFLRGKPVAISIGGARQRVPKLAKVLRGVA